MDRRTARLASLVAKAVERRAAFIDAGATDAYRLVHGAADGLPGQYVDRLGQALLVSAKGPVEPGLVEALASATGLESVYGRRLVRDVRGRDSDTVAPERARGPEVRGRFGVRENGATFLLSLEEGYSYGLFLDQRLTRGAILGGRGLASREGAPRVLNLFAYTGGFTVVAALAGARVTTIDLSRRWLDWAGENVAANGISPADHEWIRGDAFEWTRRLARKGRSFELVIVDPPTFSTSKASGVFAAERDYGRLAATAARLVSPGGTLLCCTNARRVSPASFAGTLRSGCAAAGRAVEHEWSEGQPPEFPVAPDEPAHLKVWWGRLR